MESNTRKLSHFLRGERKCSICKKWKSDYERGNGKIVCLRCQKEIPLKMFSHCLKIAGRSLVARKDFESNKTR